MVGIAVVTRAALLIARPASAWTIEEHLGGKSPECVAVDLCNPSNVLRNRAWRTLPKPQQRPELGTSRTRH